MIAIMEVFYSSQGEGRRAGVPSVFVRTGLCNLRCRGFGVKYTTPDGIERVGCDSFYSVDNKFSKNWEYYEDHLDIVDRIDNTIPRFSRHNLIKPDIVFTGGEPLINWSNDQYQRLINHYISRGHRVTIETNASLPIEFTRRYQKDIMFSMSVKLSNSGEEFSKRVNVDNISNILENSNESYLKFVISKDTWDEDYEEIKKILLDIPTYVEDVYLMPMGDTIETLEENSLFVMEKSVELGFKYSDRLHIRVWNNKQGV